MKIGCGSVSTDEQTSCASVCLQLAAWKRLQWEKETRYYEAQLHQDLWGTWIISRRWGRRHAPKGQARNTLCDSYEQGLKTLDDIADRRRKRGYTLIGSTAPLSGHH